MAGMQAGGALNGRHTGRGGNALLDGWRAGGLAGGQAGGQAGRQAFMQAGQAGR